MSKLKGFTPTFWVANVIELFERFAYYGSKAILTVYIAEKVGLGPEKAGFLVGSLFNTLLYFLPPLAGTFVDRYGFKKSLMACFTVFCIGYFLIGLGGLPMGQPLVNALGPTAYMVTALIITAAGGSLIKPCIVGTVARTTNDQTKALGYSIYYTLVNFGGAIGPILALQVRENLGIAYVLVMSSLVSLALVIGTLIFYKEPPSVGGGKTMGQVLRDMVMVFGNGRFVTFLIIFSGFWAMFWQIFYSLPFYARDILGFEKFEIIETVDAWTIILVTIPAAALAKRLSPLVAMTLGFALATLSWFVMGAFPTLALTIVAICTFALGEAIQAPRFYEYVADLAPKDQVGTYMGFAFLPIALGTFVAGATAGPLVAHYVGRRVNDVLQPGPGHAHASHMWYWIGAIGVVSTLAMLIYDRAVTRQAKAA
jgi:POT family proton-dependent oligopeptide transporter